MIGRQMEAVNVLKSIGSLDDQAIFLSPNMLAFKQGIPSNSGNTPFSSIKILFKRRWAIQRLFVAVVLSFRVGMMYYGMLLGVGGLGLNMYLSSIFNALLLLLSSLLTFLLWIPRCNRRSSVLGSCTLSGAASLISITVGHHHKSIYVGLELMALFCVCMVFNILFIYVVELLPTCARNTAASLSKQALLFASIFVPVLVVIGRSNQLFSPVVFGVTILLVAFWSFFCLKQWVRYYVTPWKRKKPEIRMVSVSQFYDGFRVGYLGDDIDVPHMRIEDTGRILHAFPQSTRSQLA